MKTEAVVISIVAVLIVGLVTIGLQRHHSQADQLACQGRMYAVGTAMLKYEEHYGHFPPQRYRDPKSGFHHSWRVLLLEFIDYDLFSKYDFGKAWDDPHNLALLRGQNYFGCEPNSPHTNVVVVYGGSTIFSSDVQHLKVKRRPRSAVLMLVQIRNSNIAWLDPNDLDINLLANNNTSSIIGLMFLDGTYRKVKKPIDANVVRSLAEQTGDLPFDFESINN